MKLLNRGKRHIHGETIVEKDAEGVNLSTPIAFVLKPNTAIDFDEKTGAFLRRLYQGELVTFEDLQRSFDGSTLAAANPPVAGKAHQNEAPAASAQAAPPSHSDLSEEEQAFIARMRAEKAQPLTAPEPETKEPATEGDDLSKLTEEELEAATAPKKTTLADKVKSALHGGA